MNEITSPQIDQSDLAFEATIRPQNLEEFIGQDLVRNQISLILGAAQLESRVADHILLAGPPGLGKTTLALIVARESAKTLRQTSGPAISHAGDLAAILSSLNEGDVLFIDEIHRMAKSAEEMLYLAMEDFRIDVMVGKGPGATSIALEIEPFTLVGATTRSGALAGPLRDRFGFTANLDFYSQHDLTSVILRSASKMSLEIDVESASAIASRGRGTPRIANRLLRRVRDYSVVHGAPRLDVPLVQRALELYEVDELGLDRLDRAVLSQLCSNYAGRAVGIATLAVAVGESVETIETVVEPFLVRAGLVVRTPKGREATAMAYQHLKMLR